MRQGESLTISDLVHREFMSMDYRQRRRFREVLANNLPAFITRAARLARGSGPVETVIVICESELEETKDGT